MLAKHPEGRHDEIAQVKSEIEGLGRRALIVTTDVSHVGQVQSMIEEACRTMGRVDILVNNAGWTGTTPALAVTEDEYNRTMASSMKSVFFACQAAARVMIPQGGGKIINIGSNFGVVAFQGRSVYAAAKAGVHHLSRALSLEWAKHGVNVNVVAPCITETDSRKAILDRPGYKEWATTQMLPRADGTSRTTSSAPCCFCRAGCRIWSSVTCSWSTVVDAPLDQYLSRSPSASGSRSWPRMSRFAHDGGRIAILLLQPCAERRTENRSSHQSLARTRGAG